MKTRNIIDRNIVWFGSIGKNPDGTAIKTISPSQGQVEKISNYVGGKEGVVSGITQYLNILQGELWYRINDGIPLWGKYKSKNIFDAYISETIYEYPDVINIASFNSKVVTEAKNNRLIYSADIVINTKAGLVNLSYRRDVS